METAHRSGRNELRSIAHKAMLQRGLLPDFSPEVIAETERIARAAVAADAAIRDLRGLSVGPWAGQKLFTLQSVAPRLQGPTGDPNGAARAGGFSLHAGVDIGPHQREKLERLCRYVSRPPIASERLAPTASGHVRYTLKTPYTATAPRTSCWNRWT